MKNRPNKSFNRVLFLVFSLLLFSACNTQSEAGPNSTPTTNSSHITEFTSLCETTPELGLDYTAAAKSFSLTEKSDGLSLQELGLTGSNEIASELLSGNTFCTMDVSPTTQGMLTEVMQLVSEKKYDEARNLLDQLLLSINPSSGNLGGLAMITLGSTRQAIADFIAAAEAEVVSGLGDGQDFMNAAQSSFNQFADQQLKSGGFKDMINLAEEAAWLGNEDVMQQALERARQMNREDIEEALKDFDPCLPNSEQVKQDIADLLKKLQTSMILGDNSNSALNQATMIWIKIGQAVQIHFMDEPIANMIPEDYLAEPPACCKDGYITVEQAAFTEYFSAEIPYKITSTQEGNKINGEGELSYAEELAGKTYNYQMRVSIDGTCVLVANGNQLEITITTTGEVTISGGSATGGWSLNDEHMIVLPEVEGANQDIIREGVVYRIFTLHPDEY